MAVKFDILSDRIKKHISHSKSFTVDKYGNVVLDNKYCDACTIINRLVCEGAVSTDELVKLLQ